MVLINPNQPSLSSSQTHLLHYITIINPMVRRQGGQERKQGEWDQERLRRTERNHSKQATKENERERESERERERKRERNLTLSVALVKWNPTGSNTVPQNRDKKHKLLTSHFSPLTSCLWFRAALCFISLYGNESWLLVAKPSPRFNVFASSPMELCHLYQ